MQRRLTDRRHAGSADNAPTAPRRALLRFTAGCLVALLAVAVASVVIADNMAEQGMLHEARLRGSTMARIVVAPLVSAKLRLGDPAELRVADAALHERLREGPILHIKLWDAAGRILWSDTPGLRGRVFPLDPDESALLGTDRVLAARSDHNKPENVGESLDGELLEVYAGARDADGVPLVFESYWSAGAVAADRHMILSRMVPLALGSLVLFQLAIFPLARSLVRRVDRSQADRTKMLGHALSASDLERRRIAQQLHDGVVQDLAGLGLAIPAIREQLPETAQAQPARHILDQMTNVVREDVASLRNLLTDIYPVGLDHGGLRAAVEQLLSRPDMRLKGVDVDVESVAGEDLEDVRLMYRVIREGLRNVAEHARAAHVSVQAARRGQELEVTVRDDGRGMSGGVTEGHFGLRLLDDLLKDVGGSLHLTTRPAGGTVLRAVFPVGIAGTEAFSRGGNAALSLEAPVLAGAVPKQRVGAAHDPSRHR